jgi:hypothetical protein
MIDNGYIPGVGYADRVNKPEGSATTGANGGRLRRAKRRKC